MMHTIIHTYIHTCMHTYIHACIHACIHVQVQLYMHTCTAGEYTENSPYLFPTHFWPCTRKFHHLLVLQEAKNEELSISSSFKRSRTLGIVKAQAAIPFDIIAEKDNTCVHAFGGGGKCDVTFREIVTPTHSSVPVRSVP